MGEIMQTLKVFGKDSRVRSQWFLAIILSAKASSTVILRVPVDPTN